MVGSFLWVADVLQDMREGILIQSACGQFGRFLGVADCRSKICEPAMNPRKF
jgi:hypothetical protein